jgi:hypothetical protein
MLCSTNPIYAMQYKIKFGEKTPVAIHFIIPALQSKNSEITTKKVN